MTNLIIPINTFVGLQNKTSKQQDAALKELLPMKVVRSKPFYHNRARAQMRQTILCGLDHSLTETKLVELRNITGGTDWAKRDVKMSIQLLEKFKEMAFPEILKGASLSLITPKAKTLEFYGIDLKVSSPIIFRIESEGKSSLGAIMIHLSKDDQFTTSQSKLGAALLYHFLGEISEEEDFVDPALCLCVDGFAGTVMNTDRYFAMALRSTKSYCELLAEKWRMIGQEAA